MKPIQRRLAVALKKRKLQWSILLTALLKQQLQQSVLFDNIAEPSEELPPTLNLSLPVDVELEVVNLSDNPNFPWTTSINANLSQPEKNQLIALLKEYVDVFT